MPKKKETERRGLTEDQDWDIVFYLRTHIEDTVRLLITWAVLGGDYVVENRPRPRDTQDESQPAVADKKDDKKDDKKADKKADKNSDSDYAVSEDDTRMTPWYAEMLSRLYSSGKIPFSAKGVCPSDWFRLRVKMRWLSPRARGTAGEMSCYEDMTELVHEIRAMREVADLRAEYKSCGQREGSAAAIFNRIWRKDFPQRILSKVKTLRTNVVECWRRRRRLQNGMLAAEKVVEHHSVLVQGVWKVMQEIVERPLVSRVIDIYQSNGLMTHGKESRYKLGSEKWKVDNAALIEEQEKISDSTTPATYTALRDAAIASYQNNIPTFYAKWVERTQPGVDPKSNLNFGCSSAERFTPEASPEPECAPLKLSEKTVTVDISSIERNKDFEKDDPDKPEAKSTVVKGYSHRAPPTPEQVKEKHKLDLIHELRSDAKIMEEFLQGLFANHAEIVLGEARKLWEGMPLKDTGSDVEISDDEQKLRTTVFKDGRVQEFRCLVIEVAEDTKKE